jgi:hypothetical protein
MKIKKQFQPLIDLLNQNKHETIESLMPEILKIAGAKQASKTFLKDDEGNTTHIFCYYHKKWEPISVGYTTKQKSASGYNTMCKEGQSRWTKQQRQAKLDRDELMSDFAMGAVEAEDLKDELKAIDERKAKIVPREDGIGYDNIEE